MHASFAFAAAFVLSANLAFGQFQTTLQPGTIKEFSVYAKKIEQQLESRWDGQRPFLSIDESPSKRRKVLQGELLIEPGSPQNPIGISHGLIHDWLGDVFIPNTAMNKVLAVLQDFDRHHEIYPEIVESKLIRKNGQDFIGYWRLKQKNPLVPVALDVTQDAHYKQVEPGKWVCRAYANDISEVDNPGTAREKKLAPGKGNGFLWRLYAYWSLEAVNGGVLAECRSVSLSRDIPLGLAWAIKPVIQSVPRESLESTLRNTRAAATK
ncbi:MAG TPA: hypothetical protein VLI55_12180 [Bryobacteraceae bacterium]|nr:hypothetical protein [Bryobacteraceae bacterium]